MVLANPAFDAGCGGVHRRGGLLDDADCVLHGHMGDAVDDSVFVCVCVCDAVDDSVCVYVMLLMRDASAVCSLIKVASA